MSLNKQIISKNFSSKAKSYDKFAQIQKNTAKNLVNLISNQISNNQKILDLGSGTGFITNFLKIKNPNIENNIFELDLSSKMLKYSLNNNSKKIRADFENLPFKENSFDIITSSFSLQWSNIDQVFANISKILKKNGIFALSIPVRGSLNELKTSFKIINFYSEKEIIEKLNNLAFKKLNLVCEKKKEKFSNIILAIKNIKNIGANYNDFSKENFGNKNSFSKIRNLSKIHLKNSGENNSFAVSWQISYFIFKKC
jgi:malonyl-CoA O-methyltransferase